MNWRLKAAVQRLCAALPGCQENVYYGLQRSFGNVLYKPDPLEMLSECATLIALLQDSGVSTERARILEVGTGRRLDMPIGFYLAGAASTKTFDLHRYLKPALVMRTLEAIRAHREQVRQYFAPYIDAAALARRLDALCAVDTFPALLCLTGIEYRAPGDAANTGLTSGSIDVHVSYTVFEHIPSDVLVAILTEANRVLAPNGVALHHIDPSDHFSHEDATISAINFRQFSEQEWARHAGNQFAYHNRLRASDFAKIYAAAGQEIMKWLPTVDLRSRDALRNGFSVDSAFAGIPADVLCTRVLQVVSRPARPHDPGHAQP